MRRVTAREFQKRFQKLEEPVLVNDGIYFPRATSELMAIAEGRTQVVLSSEDRDRFLHPTVIDATATPPPRTVIPEATVKVMERSFAPRKIPDLTKTAQVKGKMGHR